jgi:hypothetical protein
LALDFQNILFSLEMEDSFVATYLVPSEMDTNQEPQVGGSLNVRSILIDTTLGRLQQFSRLV